MQVKSCWQKKKKTASEDEGNSDGWLELKRSSCAHFDKSSDQQRRFSGGMGVVTGKSSGKVSLLPKVNVRCYFKQLISTSKSCRLYQSLLLWQLGIATEKMGINHFWALSKSLCSTLASLCGKLTFAFIKKSFHNKITQSILFEV